MGELETSCDCPCIGVRASMYSGVRARARVCVCLVLLV